MFNKYQRPFHPSPAYLARCQVANQLANHIEAEYMLDADAYGDRVLELANGDKRIEALCLKELKRRAGEKPVQKKRSSLAEAA